MPWIGSFRRAAVTTIESVLGRVRRLTYGSAMTNKNLTVVPLIASDDRDTDYRTLDEALTTGWIRVTEIDHRGSVPELKVVNSGDAAVFLLDGEELVGAKQNRVVNLSILVSGHQEIVIPVSCVESGRWRYASNTFLSSPRTQFAEGRAARMQQVSRAMAMAGSRVSDQGAVWSLIAEKSGRLGASSPTAAMSAIFEKVDHSLNEVVAAFPPIEHQTGAVFMIEGHVAGLDCFDASSTWRKLATKLLRGYALDALDSNRRRPLTAIDDADIFIGRLATTTATVHPAIGEGEDVRLSASDLAGAALFARGRVIHLNVFPQA
jgi:hypothetical protein